MTNELTTELSAEQTLALLEEQGKSLYATPENLADVVSVGYLPYVQLCGSNTAEVKKGEFPIGHFALNKNKQMIDLGAEVIMMILSVRPKAVQYKPTFAAFYDPTSRDFQAIKAAADLPKSNKGFGPEFLVWLPSCKEFATYFLGNKTGRNESPNVIPYASGTNRVCKQKSELIENPEYTWHGPKTLPYDLPIDMPPADKLVEELKKFNSPPKSVEDAEQDGDGRR